MQVHHHAEQVQLLKRAADSEARELQLSNEVLAVKQRYSNLQDEHCSMKSNLRHELDERQVCITRAGGVNSVQ